MDGKRTKEDRPSNMKGGHHYNIYTQQCIYCGESLAKWYEHGDVCKSNPRSQPQ